MKLALVLCVLAGQVGALELVGPKLGAWSDFGQTARSEVLAGSAALPVDLFRDEVFWAGIETDRGRFLFDNPRTTYPDLLPPLGAELLFLVNNPHPEHDGGTTPHTQAGVQALARYAVEVLRRFPAIGMVEVGNEMNSATFAWGPGWEGAIESRAASYVRLLAPTSVALRAERPELTVLGGAAHSIPIAWFREIFARGAGAHMNALVIHPYDVRPEQLARQIALATGVRVLAGDPVRVSPEVPLVLWAEGGLRLGQEMRLGPQAILADSWHQFSYGGEDPFQRVLRQGGRDIPLTLRLGRERERVPWVPYLASDIDGFARIAAEWVQPSYPPDGPISVVYRIRAAQAAQVEVRVMPRDGGVTVAVRRNGRDLMGGMVEAGDLVEMEIGPHAVAGGADVRVILKRAR